MLAKLASSCEQPCLCACVCVHMHVCIHVCMCICVCARVHCVHVCVHMCVCMGACVVEVLSGSVECGLSSLGLLQTVYDVPLRQLPMISCSTGSKAWEQWNKVEGKKLLKVWEPQMSPSVIQPVTCTCAIPLSVRDLSPTQPFSACVHCFRQV